jgi:HEPN domain-containing protein
MDKNDHINYWLDTAAHDLNVADTLFDNERYDYCLFLGHLCLEKILKAFWVRDNISNFPPKIHDLVYLSDKTKLNFDENIKEELRLINRFNLEIRYPDYKHAFYKECNKEYADKNLIKIKELYKWILTQL